MRKILVLGATSLIAQEAARCFAKDKAWFFLVGRDEQKLNFVKDDLMTRGAAGVSVAVCDLNDTTLHSAVLRRSEDFLGGCDTVLLAYGSLSNQKLCEDSFEEFKKEFQTNFLSSVSWLHLIAKQFESRRSGCIAVISSVAGDRGRKSNYVYGTAKAALSTFLQGLRNRLSESNVQVLTIKPGFVDTPMTSGLKKGPLFASASSVGRGIYDAINNGRDVVYLPWFWRFIMMIICGIPERVFKKLSI